MKVIKEAGLAELIKQVKAGLNSKEPAISKKSGFNLVKTDAVENDTNKLFTSKGAFDLKTVITNAYTTLVNSTKTTLETSIANKLSHGGYTGTGQQLKNEINSKLPNPGYGGVHELGRYLNLHLSGSTADFDARLGVNTDKSILIQSANGNIEIGPKNTTHCHIYTDREAFYLNKEILINNNQVYHTGYKPSKSDVGLGSVNNWGASSDINHNSTSTYATTNMVAQVKGQNTFQYLGGTSDANSALTNAQYGFGATLTNGPYTNNAYGKLITYVNDSGVHNNSNNWVWQEYYDTSGRRNWRYKVNDETWNSWRTYWDSSNFDPNSKANVNHSHSYFSDGGTYGTVTLSNWVRTTGTTGWYSETYGGGIHMSDTTWVRVYNDKNFYVSSNSPDAIHSAGGVNVGGRIIGSQVFNAVWNDYAEFFPKKDGYITEAGDIIALSMDDDGEFYELATEEHYTIVGAHSDQFGHLIGGEKPPLGEDFVEWNKEKYIPVGLVGRLPVKFKGIAKKGMKVVPSDIPGVGREFGHGDSYDKVIGYIVENNNEEGIRRVKIKIGK